MTHHLILGAGPAGVIAAETLRKHAHGALSEMLILRRGNRLSVTPVTRDEWRFITALK